MSLNLDKCFTIFYSLINYPNTVEYSLNNLLQRKKAVVNNVGFSFNCKLSINAHTNCIRNKAFRKLR